MNSALRNLCTSQPRKSTVVMTYCMNCCVNCDWVPGIHCWLVSTFMSFMSNNVKVRNLRGGTLSSHGRWTCDALTDSRCIVFSSYSDNGKWNDMIKLCKCRDPQSAVNVDCIERQILYYTESAISPNWTVRLCDANSISDHVILSFAHTTRNAHMYSQHLYASG